MVAEKILVLMNTDTLRGEFNNIKLPAGKNWRLIATIDRIDPLQGIKGRKESVLKAGTILNMALEPEDLRIWVRAE